MSLLGCSCTRAPQTSDTTFHTRETARGAQGAAVAVAQRRCCRRQRAMGMRQAARRAQRAPAAAPMAAVLASATALGECSTTLTSVRLMSARSRSIATEECACLLVSPPRPPPLQMAGARRITPTAPQAAAQPPPRLCKVRYRAQAWKRCKTASSSSTAGFRTSQRREGVKGTAALALLHRQGFATLRTRTRSQRPPPSSHHTTRCGAPPTSPPPPPRLRCKAGR